MRITALVFALGVAVVPARSEAGVLDWWDDGVAAAEEAAAAIAEWSEKAVIWGGVVVYQYRHTVAGSAVGCAAGASLGAALAGVAAAVSGGAAAVATPSAAGWGCALGAVSGGWLGYTLDHAFDF